MLRCLLLLRLLAFGLAHGRSRCGGLALCRQRARHLAQRLLVLLVVDQREIARELEAHALPRRLKTLAQQAGRDWMHATLNIGVPPDGAPGLSASGMFVINPPHTLAATLRGALPAVVRLLGRGRGQGYTVDAG